MNARARRRTSNAPGPIVQLVPAPPPVARALIDWVFGDCKCAVEAAARWREGRRPASGWFTRATAVTEEDIT